MIVSALSMLVDREAIRDVVEDFMSSPALIYLAGVLTLIAGISILTFHNIWALDWRLIITLFGCVTIFSGIVRMVFPTQVKRLGHWMLATHPIVRAAALLNGGLGIFLTYKGFFS